MATRILGRRRVPVMLQSTAVECGAACLAMVLSYHGQHTPIAEIRDEMFLGRDGATAGAIARQARAYGLTTQGFRSDPASLTELTFPIIVHWGMNHFVVVERIGKDFVDIVDPDAGRRHISKEEFSSQFTGVVLQLTPGEGFTQRSRMGIGLWKFVKPFIPRSPKVISAVLSASMVLTVMGLVPALLIGYLLDQVLPTSQLDLIHVLAAGCAAYALGHTLVTLVRAELLLWFQVRIDWSMMSAFLRHLMSLPYKYFQIRQGGDLLVRVSSTSYIRDVVSSQMLAIVIDVGLLFIYLMVIGIQSWIYVMVILGIALLQIAIMLGSARRAQRFTERELRATGDAQSVLLETITAAESVKSAGAEKAAVARWSSKYSHQIDASIHRRRLDNLLDAILGLLAVSTPLLMLLMGSYMVIGGQISVGTMFALNALAAAALAPVTQLGASIKSLQTVRVHLDRLRDIFNEKPEDTDQGDLPASLERDITLEDVSFRYSGDGPAILSDINVTIQRGHMVAIVGRSGSGKSTLSRLMLGLYHPSAGTVSFSGEPLHNLDLSSLRKQCGVVTQEGSVFSGSILNNITLAAPEASLQDVMEASQLAELHTDITNMTMGYETVLGEGGSGLSGGQQQRLVLARALATRPKLLLLDEATSHLDAATEAAVHRNLADLDCTRIVIAHRLSTVRDADVIIVLDEGRIVETGTHQELLYNNSTYAHLVSEQLTV
ncbi:peptidase domain-containing ABC transporter [Natronoglycomyces albus]|uniref:Peptidase domain-containing ABC transporter n=1 Tax=Natronoglycomyces albus TaxID=2811108 RepID=A0A895XNY4_9ACTN|nr:peptidase domain-containing ABC transporter [Natronoglycomyces albus]QSB05253.1 peptidase domain-containing ABC transporter [Natronoglycomyces albus]